VILEVIICSVIGVTLLLAGAAALNRYYEPLYPAGFDPATLVLEHPETLIRGRFLPFEGIHNLRDIGGYATTNGQHVRWKRVYRSDRLNHASDSDLLALNALNLQVICDLRTPYEVQREPDRLWHSSSPEYWHIPHFDHAFTPQALLFRSQRALHREMETLYKSEIIESGAPVIGAVITRLAGPANLPMLIHCTGGKDRTGITIAVLLLALGVPLETVIADYTLTNLSSRHLIGEFSAELARAGIRGLNASRFLPLLLAPESLIRHSLDYLFTRYGTIDTYLAIACGVNEATLTRLRDNLLA